MSCLCNLVRMARPVRDGFGGRLLLLRRKTARLYGAGQRTIRRKSTKINSSQLQSTPGQRKSKRKTNAKKLKEKHFASVKRYSLSCAHSKGAYPYPTEVLGRPRKRRGLQGRGFSACLCPKTILVELRGGKVLRLDGGGLPAPRQRQGGRGSLFVPPQTATKPPRKPHNPRMAAGGTATRGRA